MRTTSDRKIRANRANARASTGPKTTQGRLRSARNALRHAFSLPVYSSKALSEDVDALARELAGEGAPVEMQELARRVAEAQIDLRRVRAARHDLLSQKWGRRFYESRADRREKLRVLGLFLRSDYDSAGPLALLEQYVTTTPQGPHKWAVILSQELHQLSALDRYERRALARRKFAIRAFDLAKGGLKSK
jgi:hypothetical protein